MHELDRVCVCVCVCVHASPRTCVCVYVFLIAPTVPPGYLRAGKRKRETEWKTEDEKLAEGEIKTGSRVAAGGTEKI